MLLKGHVRTTLQKWGFMPYHARRRIGLASDGQFLPWLVGAGFFAKMRDQTRRLHFYRGGETTGLRRTLVQAGTGTGYA